MTPPVDVGEGLVVEGDAAEEDLGTRFSVGSVAVPLYFSGDFVIHTRIIWHLQRVQEGLLTGVKDGLDDFVFAFNLIKNFVNCTDLRLNRAVRVVGSIGELELLAEIFNRLNHCVSLTGDPSITATSKDPLEVLANLVGHSLNQIAGTL
ncbi:capsular biosynthesis protein [Babesia caballi]|uniref:Capsular biosynthesis protein n=1 Tax=Babesia caballi TaxID=5871 RepID=A0AAV4LT26_BABCB|nr:capsular biosynthesis protein [Babesia caballi]